ncbi:MAG: N-acetylmuramic acid 6-phosphate etherase [Erysipelotrichaceae bacterium]|nr:N-acetylmuramic acid 6-phosphate etherase [Erysipelotrichaceae bacterium]MBQ2655746.1 N-acetylmuramic acid 6-phosphate etherase [Erysipelotrichaceae bacterium]
MAVKIDNLSTEKRNEKTKDIDLLSVDEILKIMNEEDLKVVDAVKGALPEIRIVIDECIQAYKRGGRIIYIGAGTSGRLGLMDAVEVVPTYNSDRFVGLIAGGDNAFVKAVEGAEDSRELAVEDLKNISLNEKDMVIGIAASGRTPYVIGGLDYAREVGASTGCLCCNFNTEIADHCDLPIELSAGPEVVTGSTRLKSGTCQKIVLNMISTVTMVKVGKVFGNLMVDVKATNEKLVERCRRVVMEATGCDHDKADAVLKETENNCKLAIVMILLNIPLNEAKEKLAQADDNIRIALN